MIHVIATVELQPGTREKYLREFALVKPQVAAEHGCIEYDAAVDLESGHPRQLPPRPDGAVIVEKWTSLEALNAHLVAPHMLAYRERVKDYVKGVSLQVLRPFD
jgi:quinol monooxygenase YgiN